MKAIERGDVIAGKYEVNEILGKGGMGVVVAARHRELGELFALKFLIPGLDTKPEIVARFSREAKTSISIKNPHVVRVLDVGVHEGAPFIVMEYLHGETLAANLRRRGPLPVMQAIDWFLQACEAIQAAHVLGIVHRDLKPANMLVTTSSDRRPFLKVLDFGIAKSTETNDTALTANAAVMGTALYMSPEQVRGEEVDARSDLWSLGVILYELLVGKPPFEGTTSIAVAGAILLGNYPALSTRRPDVPPLVEQVVDELLAQHREERLESVAELAARLAPFGSDEARTSNERIQRVAEHASMPPDATAVDDPFEAPVAIVQVTGPGRVTAVAVSEDLPVRRRGSWPVRVALGVVGVAAVAFGVVHFRGAGAQVGPPPRICPRGPTADCAAACDGGSLAACSTLGVFYAEGEGVPKDVAKAIDLYTKACDGGFQRACVNLGSMHFTGDGVIKNEALGARFYSQACAGGEPLGCLSESVAYFTGRGVPKDPAHALDLAHQACNGGVGGGCVRVVLAKLTGEGAPKDVKGGLAELDGMCTKGMSAACDRLFSIYSGGLGADVPPELARVAEYSKKGCDLGSGAGCDGVLLAQKVTASDSKAARLDGWLEKACEGGNNEACATFGRALVKGDAVPKDEKRGRELLGRACAAGVKRACAGRGDGGT